MVVTVAPVNVRVNKCSATMFVVREGTSSETQGDGDRPERQSDQGQKTLKTSSVPEYRSKMTNSLPVVADARAFDVACGAGCAFASTREETKRESRKARGGAYTLMTPTPFSIFVSFTLDEFGRGPTCGDAKEEEDRCLFGRRVGSESAHALVSVTPRGTNSVSVSQTDCRHNWPTYF